MKKILLMTVTIKPFADVSYKDPKTRYMEYQKNIKRYIKESNFDIIIFAENSGVDFKIDEIESKNLTKYFLTPLLYSVIVL